MSERQRDFTFKEHAHTERHDIEHPSHIEPEDFQRHQRLVQAPLLADQIDKAGDMAGAFGGGQTVS